MILPLILAAGYFFTVQSPNNPRVSHTTYEELSPMADPVLSPRQQIADRIFMERPMLDRAPRPVGNIYSDVQERYPVNDVVPRAMRQRMSTEEAMALESYQTEQLGKETAIRGQMLNQRIAQKNLDYDSKIMNQTEEAMQRVGELNPYSSDFDAQVATLYEELPLAQQNPGFRDMVGRLANTRDQYIQNKEIKDRTLMNQAQQNRERSEEYRRSQEQYISRLGTTARSTYNKAIEDGYSPEDAQAMAVDASLTSRAEAERRERETRPITRSDYTAFSNDLRRLMKNNDPASLGEERSLESLSPEERDLYDVLVNQMNTYVQQQRRRSTVPQTAPSSQAPAPSAAPSSSPAQTKAPSSYFPKSSTQKEPSGS